MSSSYPVPSCAVPVSGGMVVAVPLELLASPLKSGRDLGDGDRSALVIGGTGRIRTGGGVVFCKVVAVAEAQVKRDGQVWSIPGFMHTWFCVTQLRQVALL